MRIVALVGFLCFWLFTVAHAQFEFEGKWRAIEHLNTVEGQGCLTISPLGQNLAYSEQTAGVHSIDIISLELDSVSFRITVFRNKKLGNKACFPIGYLHSGKLIYGEIEASQGRFITKLFTHTEQSKDLIVPHFHNKSNHISGCVSQDNNFMILSFEGRHTYGVEDLYLVRKTGSGWSTPQNLGSTINTKFQEVTPFLAKDNKTLFFATNGRKGSGSFDLFYSLRLDDSWRNWSEPQAIKLLNTSGSETSFSYKGNWAYFVRSGNSESYGDIFKIKFKENFEEADSVILENPKLVDKPKTIGTQLEVISEKSKAKLKFSLLFKDSILAEEVVTYAFDPNFSFEQVEIKSSGYFPKIIEWKSLLSGLNQLELKPIEMGASVTLEHVFFERSTTNMLEGSEQDLLLLVEMLNENPEVKILIKGHTDNQGSAEKNNQLSEERAQVVKEYLVERGIGSDRLSSKGYGSSQPRASNATKATRKLNRRVEFEVVKF